MRALIIVDEQNDFISGSLAVAGGAEVIEPTVRMAKDFDLVIATRDWHPEDHCSFADGEPTFTDGSWPMHCVANSHGAQLPSEVEAVAEIIVDKGYKPDLETYSGFADEIHIAKHPDKWFVGMKMPLNELLEHHGIKEVVVVGLATDYCVISTAEDALEHGFDVTIDPVACRGVDAEASEIVLNDFKMLDGAAVAVN